MLAVSKRYSFYVHKIIIIIISPLMLITIMKIIIKMLRKTSENIPSMLAAAVAVAKVFTLDSILNSMTK